MRIQQGIRIVSTGRELPAQIVTNDMMRNFVDTTDEWIRERTGIEQRRVCISENNADLAFAAARKALEKLLIKDPDALSQISAVITATSTPDDVFPSTAALVQKMLGLEKDVMAFDLYAACTGFVYGLKVCAGLLSADSRRYVLLIGSEKLSSILDYTDRTSCILFGDGAACAVLERSELAFYHRAWTDGDVMRQALSCKGPGSEGKLLMDGKVVFRFAVKALYEGIEGVLNDAELDISDVDHVVCHQANKRIIEHVKKEFVRKGYDSASIDKKFVMNIAKYGNTSAASIPILLDEMFEDGKLESGMKIICAGFGAGLTWSAALFEI